MTGMNVLATGLGLVTGPILARSLGPSGRGTLAAILVPLALAPSIFDFGVSAFVTRGVARRDSLGTLFASTAALAVILGVIGAAFAPLIATVLAHGRPVVYRYLLIGLFLLPVALLGNLLLAVATGREKWTVVLVARFTPFLGTAAGLVTLFVFDGITVGRAALVTILSWLTPVVVSLPAAGGIGCLKFDPKVAIASLRFGIKAWLGGLGSLANYRLDQLLMIPLVNARELGLYVVAVTLSGFAGILTIGSASILSPRVAQGDIELAVRASRVLLAVVAVSSILLAVVTPWVLPIAFGSGFREAVPMAWILLAAIIPLQGAFTLGTSLTAAGHPGAFASSEGLALLVTIPGLILALPALGGVGAAIISLLAYSAKFIYLVIVAKKTLSRPFRSFLVPDHADILWARGLVRPLLGRWV